MTSSDFSDDDHAYFDQEGPPLWIQNRYWEDMDDDWIQNHHLLGDVSEDHPPINFRSYPNSRQPLRPSLQSSAIPTPSATPILNGPAREEANASRVRQPRKNGMDTQEGWHDVTPLIACVAEGDLKGVVKLLKLGFVDPWLEACPAGSGEYACRPQIWTAGRLAAANVAAQDAILKKIFVRASKEQRQRRAQKGSGAAEQRQDEKATLVDVESRMGGLAEDQDLRRGDDRARSSLSRGKGIETTASSADDADQRRATGTASSDDVMMKQEPGTSSVEEKSIEDSYNIESEDDSDFVVWERSRDKRGHESQRYFEFQKYVAENVVSTKKAKDNIERTMRAVMENWLNAKKIFHAVSVAERCFTRPVYAGARAGSRYDYADFPNQPLVSVDDLREQIDAAIAIVENENLNAICERVLSRLPEKQTEARPVSFVGAVVGGAAASSAPTLLVCSDLDSIYPPALRRLATAARDEMFHTSKQYWRVAHEEMLLNDIRPRRKVLVEQYWRCVCECRGADVTKDVGGTIASHRCPFACCVQCCPQKNICPAHDGLFPPDAPMMDLFGWQPHSRGYNDWERPLRSLFLATRPRNINFFDKLVFICYKSDLMHQNHVWAGDRT